MYSDDDDDDDDDDVLTLAYFPEGPPVVTKQDATKMRLDGRKQRHARNSGCRRVFFPSSSFDTGNSFFIY